MSLTRIRRIGLWFRLRHYTTQSTLDLLQRNLSLRPFSYIRCSRLLRIRRSFFLVGPHFRTERRDPCPVLGRRYFTGHLYLRVNIERWIYRRRNGWASLRLAAIHCLKHLRLSLHIRLILLLIFPHLLTILQKQILLLLQHLILLLQRQNYLHCTLLFHQNPTRQLLLITQLHPQVNIGLLQYFYFIVKSDDYFVFIVHKLTVLVFDHAELRVRVLVLLLVFVFQQCKVL